MQLIHISSKHYQILDNRIFKGTLTNRASDFVGTKVLDFGGIENSYNEFCFIEAI